jgi:5-methylcytosine-specific restriction endonuclease McrA
MSRAEFTKPTKRAALHRAGGVCEATGELYGLPAGTRCGRSLAHGVEFDHVILDANSKDNSMENCAAVCPPCHKHKTAKHDIPVAAETLRQQDKHRGIRRRKGAPMPGSRASGWKKPMNGPAVRR